MIDRRTFLAATAAAAALGATRASAQQAGVTVEEVGQLFRARPRDIRRMAQRGLKAAGYYTGAIDGAWGPGTAEAYRKLIASERYQRHARAWTWSREVQVMDTLLFLETDAYL